MYHCIVCDVELFDSDHKYSQDCVGPAFYKGKNLVELRDDRFTPWRVAVKCENCGSFVGHVFKDELNKLVGGKRYMVNSGSLSLQIPPHPNAEEKGVYLLYG